MLISDGLANVPSQNRTNASPLDAHVAIPGFSMRIPQEPRTTDASMSITLSSTSREIRSARMEPSSVMSLSMNSFGTIWMDDTSLI